MATLFGNYLRGQRARRRISLRQFSQRAALDPGNVSKLERGLLAPPESEDVLMRYAGALGIARGSVEWQELVDMAAASRGELPPDLSDDAAVVSALPLLFRTLRGQRVTPQLMQAVVRKVRESRSKDTR